MIRSQEIQSRQDLVNYGLHRIKTKFHRKHLTLDTIEELYLKKVRLKKVFCRSYKEQESDKDIIFELNKHRYLKNKPLCGLKTVEIASVAKLHWFSQLKNLKNLESLTVWIGEEDWKATRGFANTEAKVHFLLQCLKRLSKKMKTLKLYIEGLSVKDIARVYRIVSSFRELKVFYRRLGFEDEQSYLTQEHKYMTRYLKRMKRLEEFDYDYWRFRKEDWDDGEPDGFPESNQDQDDYYGMMTRGETFNYVTGLNLAVRGSTLETFDADNGEFDPEKRQAVRIRKETQEEIAQFYRFELFPNLQNLMIDINENSIHPVGPFMTEGFRALKKLEKLFLILNDRPQQAHYVFQALEHLPLLTSFYLSIEFLRKYEWLDLQKFIGKQKNLVSFRLRLLGFDISRQDDEKFEELFTSLPLASKLEYLQISANTISLERISKAVMNISGINQLKHLTIGGIDDPKTSAKPAERCQGICDLISRHKESLASVKLEFAYVVVPEIIGILTSAIGDLKKLKKLRLEVNNDTSLTDFYAIYFEEHLEAPTLKEMTEDKRWICQITRMLEKLENLETIEIDLLELPSTNKVIVDQFMEMLGTILSLKAIDNVNLCMPFEVIKQVTFDKFARHLLKMQLMRKISLKLDMSKIINPIHANLMRHIVQEANSRQLANVRFFC